MGHLIAAITAIAGLLWALNSLQRSGIGLNPFAAYRRWQWKKTHNVKPLYNLRDPTEVAAVLLLGTAKCKGELTSGQKAKLVQIFTEVLKLPRNEADDLMVAATFLLRDEVYVGDNVSKVLANTRQQLTPEQKASLLNLMEEVAAVDGSANQEQRNLITRTIEAFNQR